MMNTDRDLHDDASAVARVRAGEREAFGPLWQRYSPSVLRLCQRLLGPVPEAQDLAQETALQAYLELSHLREPARFGAWLHAIAANLARMALRRRRTVSLEAITTDATIQSLLWTNHPPRPDDALLAREVHHRIVQALNDLSTVNRAAVVHFYLEGYSYIELAEVLGVPVSTVKGRLFAGRQHLKQALAPVAQEVLNVAPRSRKEPVMPSDDLVPVVIESIQTNPLSAPSKVVLLRETDGQRVLPIWMDQATADAIAVAQEGQPPTGTHPRRPQTHDLSLQLLEAAGAQIEHVIVRDLSEAGVFFAEIGLLRGRQRHRIDARPSDALALAVRRGRPLYVARPLWETAAILREPDPTPEDDPTTWASPFSDHLWAFFRGLRQAPSSASAGQPTQPTDWTSAFPARPTSWDGRPMIAIDLPTGAETATLILEPATWDELAWRARRYQGMPGEAADASLSPRLPFDDGAHRILDLATAEAHALHHNYLGTEHLLLALTREGSNDAARILVALGLTPERIHHIVATLIGRGMHPIAEIPTTPRLKAALNQAQQEAHQRGHAAVGPAHLLLGLMSVRSNGVATAILANLGLLSRAREQLVALLDSGAPDAPSAGETTA